MCKTDVIFSYKKAQEEADRLQREKAVQDSADEFSCKKSGE